LWHRHAVALSWTVVAADVTLRLLVRGARMYLHRMALFFGFHFAKTPGPFRQKFRHARYFCRSTGVAYAL